MLVTVDFSVDEEAVLEALMNTTQADNLGVLIKAAICAYKPETAIPPAMIAETPLDPVAEVDPAPVVDAPAPEVDTPAPEVDVAPPAVDTPEAAPETAAPETAAAV